MKKIIFFFLALFSFAYSSHLLAAADPATQFGPLPKGWVYTGYGADFGVARGSTFNAAVAREGQLIWESVVPARGRGIDFKTSNALKVGAVDAVVKTSGAVTAGRVFAGVRGVLGGPLGIGLLVAPPIIEYLASENVRPNQDVSSSAMFQMADNSVCTVAPCYSWNISLGAAAPSGIGPHRSFALLKATAIARLISHYGVDFWDAGSSAPLLKVSSQYGTWTYSASKTGVAPGIAPWLPASMDDIAPYMEAGGIATPALMDTVLGAGGSFETETKATTGPVTVNQGNGKFNTVILPLPSTEKISHYPGPPVFIGDGKIGNGYRDVRVEGVPQFEGGRMSADMMGTVAQLPTSTTRSQVYDGPSDTTKVTDTTTYPGGSVDVNVKQDSHMTYSQPGGKATVDAKTKTEVTTTVKDANGNTISQTTQTQTDVKPKDKPDDAFQDKELPPLPVFYVRKYPDGLVGIWNEKSAVIKATPLLSLVSGLMPSVADAGACPSFPIDLDFATWATFGTHDVAPPCWVWDFGKLIITISALLLARALIFGG